MTAMRKMLRSKIHRATVTHADVHYEGSISIPPELLAAADMLEHEAVCVWNVSSGTRFETYTIKGISGSTDVCVNGAAAHLVRPGDIIIIACFTWIDEAHAKEFVPTVIFVDEQNRKKARRAEVAGPQTYKA